MTPAPPDSAPLVRWGAASDVGPVRAENEDSWVAVPPLFAVADGLGGREDGAAASAEAVRVLGGAIDRIVRAASRPTTRDLEEAIARAAASVGALADPADPDAAPGTTLTGVLLLGAPDPAWYAFNIGDSRVYIVSREGIRRATTDHSALEEADALARRTGGPAIHPPANLVTRVLGAGARVPPGADYSLVPLRDGDLAIVCTDGVHGVLADEDLLAIARSEGEPQAIADRLVEVALGAGTRDNATALVVLVDVADPRRRA